MSQLIAQWLQRVRQISGSTGAARQLPAGGSRDATGGQQPNVGDGHAVTLRDECADRLDRRLRIMAGRARRPFSDDHEPLAAVAWHTERRHIATPHEG